MKITFGANTIADDTASPRILAKIEQCDAPVAVQEDELAFSAIASQIPRGNAKGQFICTAACSYATRALAVAALVTQNGLKNTQATLSCYEPSTTLAFVCANAVLQNVALVLLNGTQLILRYTFKITTITSS